jgi:hypothetical protein
MRVLQKLQPELASLIYRRKLGQIEGGKDNEYPEEE